MTIFRDNEGNERIQPSQRAIDAQERWLEANPHYADRIREQMIRYAKEELRRRKVAEATERARRARQARRQLAWIIVSSMLAGAALAFIVDYFVYGVR